MVKESIEIGDPDGRTHIPHLLIGDGNIVPGMLAR
jgi:hypothetical protein